MHIGVVADLCDAEPDYVGPVTRRQAWSTYLFSIHASGLVGACQRKAANPAYWHET